MQTIWNGILNKGNKHVVKKQEEITADKRQTMSIKLMAKHARHHAGYVTAGS
jgi:hypothetical protein